MIYSTRVDTVYLFLSCKISRLNNHHQNVVLAQDSMIITFLLMIDYTLTNIIVHLDQSISGENKNRKYNRKEQTRNRNIMQKLYINGCQYNNVRMNKGGKNNNVTGTMTYIC